MDLRKRKCLLCKGNGKLTAEHKIKASLLKYFNDIENTDPNKILKFDNGSDLGGEFKSIKNAKNLKPIKNICTECNSSKSSVPDSYFHIFVIEAYEHQNKTPEILQLRLPKQNDIFEQMEIYRSNANAEKSNWMDFYLYVNSKYYYAQKYQIFTHSYNSDLIKRYLAKHTACYLDRSKLDVPDFLCNIFLEGTNLEMICYDILYMSKDFNHGYQNSMMRFPKNKMEYSLIFSNLAIRVTIPYQLSVEQQKIISPGLQT